MRMKSIAILLLLFIGCSTYKLAIPTTVKKSENVKVLILPFEDLTNTYKNEYQLEKIIADKIENQFKGIRRNPYTRTERPLYFKVPNPYVIEYIDTNSLKTDKELKEIIKEHSPDVIVKGTIERIDYANTNKSVLASYAVFGLIGAAITSESNKKVSGFIGLRLEFINTQNDITFLVKTTYGKSASDYPEKLSREVAIKQAVNSAAENVLEIFSLTQ